MITHIDQLLGILLQLLGSHLSVVVETFDAFESHHIVVPYRRG